MKKRIQALFLVTALACSLFNGIAVAVETPAAADMVIDVAVSVNTLKEDVIDLQDNVQQFPEISISEVQFDAQRSDGIKITSFTDSNITPMSANTPPIAELQYIIMNPESLLNGQITTATQIAWLWSYNGVDFTYDLDGDTILNRSIGGISSNDIAGYLVGNIGFVTQFQTAAQYQMTFRVQDENGAWSNTFKIVINVEPIDGHARPNCVVQPTTTTPLANSLMAIYFGNSTDYMGGRITDIRGMVFDSDGNSSNVVNYIPFMDGSLMLTSTEMYLRFPEAGDYDVWISVMDSLGAWSNWGILSMEVDSVNLRNVTINGIYEPTSISAWWVDQSQAKNYYVENSWDGANYLLEHFGSHDFPYALPNKLVMDTSFSVTGRVVNGSGAPVANTNVRIQMPTTSNRPLDQTVQTDSNGYFSYAPSTAQYWVDAGYYPKPEEVNLLKVGDHDSQYIRFSSSTGTNFLYPTTVTVSSNGQTYSEDVTCEIGYNQKPILGNLLYQGGKWHYV